jgi:hypothetical protein
MKELPPVVKEITKPVILETTQTHANNNVHPSESPVTEMTGEHITSSEASTERKPRHHGKHRRNKRFSKHRHPHTKRRSSNGNEFQQRSSMEGEDTYNTSAKKDDVIKE